MNITELIHHPERMDRETLFDLRNLTALHPYYQTARILMLQNLYLLHDPTFGEELRTAAIYITDRKVLFNLFEAAHYKIPHEKREKPAEQTELPNRTTELIDSFLESIPEEEQPEEQPTQKRRKPTPADAAVDYVSYLIECDTIEDNRYPAPQLIGHSLIDDFLEHDGGRFVLPEITEEYPSVVNEEPDESQKSAEDGIFTERMAKIYIKQGRYSQALEIIKRLNLENPKKSCYFADQIRFLEKLIVNNNKK